MFTLSAHLNIFICPKSESWIATQ